MAGTNGLTGCWVGLESFKVYPGIDHCNLGWINSQFHQFPLGVFADGYNPVSFPQRPLEVKPVPFRRQWLQDFFGVGINDVRLA